MSAARLLHTVFADGNITERRRKRPRSGNAGFVTVEVVAMLLVVLTLLPILYAAWNMGLDSLKKRTVAQQLLMVGDAAKTYARTQGLLSTLTPGAAALQVSVSSLVSAGALPAPPSGTTLHNLWGQIYNVYYFVPASTPSTTARLIIVVLTATPSGGTPPSNTTLTVDAPQAAALAGAGGGWVTNAGTAGSPSYVLHGAGGVWDIPLGSTVTPMKIPAPDPGNIGLYMSLDDFALGSDVLYRVSVPGRPELNRMTVDLDMRANNINNANSVQFNATSVTTTNFATICSSPDAASNEGRMFYYTAASSALLNGVYICRSGVPVLLKDNNNSPAITVSQVGVGTTGSGLVNKPVCGSGMIPYIIVTPDKPSGLGTLVTGTIYTQYVDASSTQWKVSMFTLGALGVSIAVNGTASVITTCIPSP